MTWISPPTRREITLIVLCLSVYLFGYNLDSSFQLLGVDPGATQGAVLSRLGFAKTKYISRDGRKPAGWRDSLEDKIFGKWAWDEGHVAGDGQERSQSIGTGRHGASWTQIDQSDEVAGHLFEDSTVDKSLTWWQDDIPQTKVIQHVPGYTILDNLFIHNGTVFIVTDNRDSFPDLPSIITSTGPGFRDWVVLSTEDSVKRLGGYGGSIRGVSWMAADTTPHNSTLFSLWRTYSSLDLAIDQSGQTTLAPPRRLIFPHNRFYTDANPPFEQHWIKRRRVDTGFHPYLLKAAFPQLTVMYFEDWEDYEKMEIPFMIERIVVADRRAANSKVHFGEPIFSPPFSLEASEHWFEPVRQTLVQYFDVNQAEKTPVVTYIHTQGEFDGAKLTTQDHDRLSRALKKMSKDYGYEVHVVSSVTDETDWSEKMRAIIRSTIVLGVHGNHLWDSVFMKLSPSSTLMEFYPEDSFLGDQVLAAHSANLKYQAWWGSRFGPDEDDLPPISPPNSDLVQVDAGAVVREIHRILSGR